MEVQDNKKEFILLSIIIPCYNLENYIEKTVKNLLSEKLKSNIEIIIIDDNSTDNSKNLLKKLKMQDKRISIIKKNKNEGVSKARNTGINKSKGKYLLFLDGDDELKRGSLQKIEEKLLSEKNIDIFSYGYQKIFSNKIRKYQSLQNSKKIFNETEFLKLFLLKKIPQCIGSFVVKKELVLKNIKFKSRLQLGEDLIFQINILLNNKVNIYYEADIYLNYIQRLGSAVHKKIDEKIFLIFEYLKSKEIKNENIINEFFYFKIMLLLYIMKQIILRGIEDIDSFNKNLKNVYIFRRYKRILFIFKGGFYFLNILNKIFY